MLRRPEHLTIDELPACLLLLRLLVLVDLVVDHQIAMQSAHHDHGDHARQEQNDHDGVHDGEPVDLRIRHLEVHVPARRPLDGRCLPVHIVRVDDVHGGQVGVDRQRGHTVMNVILCGAALELVQLHVLIVPGAFCLVTNTARANGRNHVDQDQIEEGGGNKR